jgi:hypothetical protein
MSQGRHRAIEGDGALAGVVGMKRSDVGGVRSEYEANLSVGEWLSDDRRGGRTTYGRQCTEDQHHDVMLVVPRFLLDDASHHLHRVFRKSFCARRSCG